MSETIERDLDRAALIQVSLRAFHTQPTMLEECARCYAVEHLVQTVRRQAAELTCMLRELPDSAYAEQPDDLDGSDVWSAGQVARHLADVEVASLPVWEALFERELEPPDPDILEALDTRLPTRAQSVAAAVALEQSAEAITSIALRQAGNGRRAAHFALGVVGIRGALLGVCIHVADHLGQLEELRSASAGG
jgi:hypothetical protein